MARVLLLLIALLPVRSVLADAELSLLLKVQQAAQKSNYNGTFIYQQGSVVQSSRIVHLHDGQGERAYLEILDGKPREVLRINNEIHALNPEQRTVVVEKVHAVADFPGLNLSNPADLAQHYRLRKTGNERVAGFDCLVLELSPRDAARYGYRLWIEKDSHLLLRMQTLGEAGGLLEQVAFTDLRIGGVIKPAALEPKASIKGWKVETVSSQTARLADAGWTIRPSVPGFRTVREIRRNAGSATEVGQIVLSDGLAAVSVFIEASGPKPPPEGSFAQGATHIVSRRLGEFTLTVLGEAPAATIRQIAQSVEYSKPSR